MPNNQNIPNSNSSSTSYRVEEEFVSGTGKSPRTNTADTNADTVASFETILDNIESETALEDAMESEGINDAVIVPIREEIVALNSWLPPALIKLSPLPMMVLILIQRNAPIVGYAQAFAMLLHGAASHLEISQPAANARQNQKDSFALLATNTFLKALLLAATSSFFLA